MEKNSEVSWHYFLFENRTVKHCVQYHVLGPVTTMRHPNGKYPVNASHYSGFV